MDEIDGWKVFSGLFTIILIDQGSQIQARVKKDFPFKLLYVFVSVLIYIHDIKLTLALMTIFFLSKFSIQPYIKGAPVSAGDPSLDSKQP